DPQAALWREAMRQDRWQPPTTISLRYSNPALETGEFRVRRDEAIISQEGVAGGGTFSQTVTRIAAIRLGFAIQNLNAIADRVVRGAQRKRIASPGPTHGGKAVRSR